MKKIYFLILCGLWHISTESHYTATNSPQKLSINLINALHGRSTNAVKQALQRIVAAYGHNPQAFVKVMTTGLPEQGIPWTPLMHAVSLGDTERVGLILNTMTDVLDANTVLLAKIINEQDSHGKTALYHAVERHNIPVTKQLLQATAQLYKNDKKSFFDFLTRHTKHLQLNPLMLAVFHSIGDIITALVHQAQNVFGADSQQFSEFINAKDAFGRTALDLSVDPGDRIFLLNHKAAQAVDHQEDKATTEQHRMSKLLMHYASHSGYTDKLESLLDEAREKFSSDPKDFLYLITTRDDAGWTPLINAAANGHKDYISIILDAVKKYFDDEQLSMFFLTIGDIHGRSALHLAIQRHHYHTTKNLIENEKKLFGNDKKLFMQFINQKGELNGFTPLLLAANISTDDEISFDVIQMLVERAQEVLGLDSFDFEQFINARDLDDKTALAYANNKKIYNYLKQHGAHL